MTEGNEPMKRYSVLLLYPDWANDGGRETYYAFVEAADSRAAIAEAQRKAVAANDWPDIDPDDFAPLLVTEGHNEATDGGRENDVTESKEQELRLSCCPRCGGEIQATIERYYSLRGGVWIESGVDGDSRLYCENDCDLSEYAGRIPPIG